MNRCLQVVPDPAPADLAPYKGLADEKDLPILATAVREQCPYLVTFNVRHYQPGHEDVSAVRPGAFIQQVRYLLAHLT